MGICCMAQETQTGALCQSRGVGWGVRWEGGSKGRGHMYTYGGFPGSSDGNESACSVGDLGLIPGLGRSPGEGNGNPLQYSCLGNPTDGGAWQATVHGVTKNRT